MRRRQKPTGTVAPAIVGNPISAPVEKTEITNDDLFVGLVNAIKGNNFKVAKLLVSEIRLSTPRMAKKRHGTVLQRKVTIIGH